MPERGTRLRGQPLSGNRTQDTKISRLPQDGMPGRLIPGMQDAAGRADIRLHPLGQALCEELRQPRRTDRLRRSLDIVWHTDQLEEVGTGVEQSE